MIKKTISYKDLDGNPKTEDFWFQITQAEFVEQVVVEGGETYLEQLSYLASLSPDNMQGQGRKMMSVFKTLLADAVGRRVQDAEGDLFIKNEHIKNRFMFSGAYDAFFLELIQTPDSGAVFLRNILPRDAGPEIDKAMKERGMTVSEETPTAQTETPELQAAAPQLEEPGKDEQPAWLKDMREPTSEELRDMSKEEMTLAFRLKSEGKLNIAAK